MTNNNEYKKGQRLTLSINNQAIQADVLRVDDDDNIILYTDAPVAGRTINKYKKADIDAMCKGIMTEQEANSVAQQSLQDEAGGEISTLIFVVLVLAIVRHAVKIFTDCFTIGLGVHIIINICAIVSFAMMLNCKKWGYYLYLITALVNLVYYIALDGDVFTHLIVTVIMTGLVSAILLIRKNGISAFRAMGIKIG